MVPWSWTTVSTHRHPFQQDLEPEKSHLTQSLVPPLVPTLPRRGPDHGPTWGSDRRPFTPGSETLTPVGPSVVTGRLRSDRV